MERSAEDRWYEAYNANAFGRAVALQAAYERARRDAVLAKTSREQLRERYVRDEITLQDFEEGIETILRRDER